MTKVFFFPTNASLEHHFSVRSVRVRTDRQTDRQMAAGAPYLGPGPVVNCSSNSTNVRGGEGRIYSRSSIE